MKDIAQELVKVARELTARTKITWEAKAKGDDLICRVIVAFDDVGAWGDDVGDVLDAVSKAAAKKLALMEPEDVPGYSVGPDLRKGWTTSSRGLYMEWVYLDGGGVWERENVAKWR